MLHRAICPRRRRRPARGSSWSRATIEDPSMITVDGGFRPGAIYALSYIARGPRVVGLGLAGIRDALLFFRHDRVDHYGAPNPLGENGAELPKAVIAYGASQSARL